MKKELFWKNFNLGTELSVSGNFIYNGLKAFDELKTFYYEDEIFEFLYDISVGIERLEKIAIILIEHDSIGDQEAFEKSLITHSHLDLLARIKQKYNLKLSNPHNSFIQLLGRFYKTMRYDRYSLREVHSYDKEKQAIKEYIAYELGIKFDESPQFLVIENNYRIKKFIGRIVGKIAKELYRVISNEAKRQNMYTYEIRTNSKAYKIFVRKEFDFQKETILWKELLIFLLNNKEQEGVIDFIKGIESLGFDLGLASDYLGCFQSDLGRLEHIDELEALYKDVVNKKDRLEMLEQITNPNVCFDLDPDEDTA